MSAFESMNTFVLSEGKMGMVRVTEARLPVAPGQTDFLVQVSKVDGLAWVGPENPVYRRSAGLDRDQAKALACLLLTFARTGEMPATAEDDYVLYADVGDVIARLTRERDEAQQEVAAQAKRIHELEAPPVVPEGWLVDRWHTGDSGPELGGSAVGLWCLAVTTGGEPAPVMFENEDDRDGHLLRLMPYEVAPADAVAGLLHAIRTNQPPPHAVAAP